MIFSDLIKRIASFLDSRLSIGNEKPHGNGDDAGALLQDMEDRTISIGLSLLGVFFIIFGGWASFAPLESAAIGVGVVQVDGNRQPVQHLEGGIVTEILVKNGDHVNFDQPLIQLDDTELNAQRKIKDGRRLAMRASVDRLIAERDDLQQIVFSPELMIASEERTLSSMASEETIFAARRADRLGEVEVLEQKITQLTNSVEGAQAVLRAKMSVVESLESEIAELRALLVEGYVDKQRILQLERTRTQLLGELSDLTAAISNKTVGIKETELQVLQLEKRFKMQVVDELAESQEKLFDLEQQVRAISARLDRTLIRAPTAGYVLDLQPNTIGAVIRPSDELLSIVPDTAKLVVGAKMSPMDIDRIKIGQQAELRFSVFKDAYSITGTVSQLSHDRLVDDRSGEPYYQSVVTLLEEDLALLYPYELVPGMPADVLIKTGSRTLIGYITSPLNRMFEKSLVED